MNNQKYRYSYNISMEANEKEFVDICELLQKMLPDIKKRECFTDVDGSLIQIYYYLNEEIAVYNDYYVDAVYINSNTRLDDIIGKKSIY